MVNNAWILDKVNAFADLIVPGCISDHSCCIVALDQCGGGRKKSFKFLNMWTSHDTFKPVIRENWCTNKWGNAQFLLKQKFNSIKKPLQSLNS